MTGAADPEVKTDPVCGMPVRDSEHVMRRTIVVNASHFNTHRIVQQYAASAYL